MGPFRDGDGGADIVTTTARRKQGFPDTFACGGQEIGRVNSADIETAH